MWEWWRGGGAVERRGASCFGLGGGLLRWVLGINGSCLMNAEHSAGSLLRTVGSTAQGMEGTLNMIVDLACDEKREGLLGFQLANFGSFCKYIPVSSKCTMRVSKKPYLSLARPSTRSSNHYSCYRSMLLKHRSLLHSCVLPLTMYQ